MKTRGRGPFPTGYVIPNSGGRGPPRLSYVSHSKFFALQPNCKIMEAACFRRNRRAPLAVGGAPASGGRPRVEFPLAGFLAGASAPQPTSGQRLTLLLNVGSLMLRRGSFSAGADRRLMVRRHFRRCRTGRPR